MSLLDTASNVTIDKYKARELLEAYRAAKAPATDEDREIMAVYREIARGRVVIRVRESIRAAGWNDEGLPKLAMTMADQRTCFCDITTGGATFYAGSSRYRKAKY